MPLKQTTKPTEKAQNPTSDHPSDNEVDQQPKKSPKKKPVANRNQKAVPKVIEDSNEDETKMPMEKVK